MNSYCKYINLSVIALVSIIFFSAISPLLAQSCSCLFRGNRYPDGWKIYLGMHKGGVIQCQCGTWVKLD